MLKPFVHSRFLAAKFDNKILLIYLDELFSKDGSRYSMNRE